MSFSKKLIKGTGFLFLSTLGVAVINYILRIVLARNLSVTEFGLTFSIIALFGMFGLFIDFGLNSSIIKHLSEFNAKKAISKSKSSLIMVAMFQFVLSALVGVLFMFFSPYIAQTYLSSPQVYPLIILFSVYFVMLPLISLIKSTCVAFHKTELFAMLELGQFLFILCLTALLIYLDVGMYSLFVAYSLFGVFGFLISFILLKKTIFPKFSKIKLKLDKSLFKVILSFGFFMFLYNIFNLFFGKLDLFLITLFRDLKEVGYYSVALPTAMAIANLSSSIILVLLSVTSEMWAKKQYKKLEKNITEIYKYFLFFIPPISITLFMFSEFIITLLFGQKYFSAVILLQTLSIGITFIVLMRINAAILAGMENQKQIGVVMVIAFVVNLISSLVLIPIFGALGAAISAIVSFGLAGILLFNILIKKINISIKPKLLLKYIIAYLGLFVVQFGVKNLLYCMEIINVSVSLGLSGIIYVIIIQIFNIIDIKEIYDHLKSIKF